MKRFSTFTGMAAALTAALLASAADAATFASNKISFRDITGAIEIRTTSGDEIDITIEQGRKSIPVMLSEKDGVVIVSGERWRDDGERNCCDGRITREFHPRDGRKLTTGEPVDNEFFADYPIIRVSMPVTGAVDFIDARMILDMERLNGPLSLDACYVYGQTSDVDEAVIGVIHGSRLVMGNIKGGVEIDTSGDADVMIGDAAIVDIDIAGPGDVVVGDVDGMLDVSIAGSGLARVARTDGPVTARIAGSGALSVKAGRADRLRAIIDGSGGVFFNGDAHQPDLKLYGSSEVHMERVTGRITRVGGGSVYVGGEKVRNTTPTFTKSAADDKVTDGQ